jgi:hypothetical protein
MKYIEAALIQIGADFWAAVLRVFVPAIVLGYMANAVATALGEPAGPYVAFVFVHIPALCLVVLLVAESGGIDFGALWDGLRMVYAQAVLLGILLVIPRIAIEGVSRSAPDEESGFAMALILVETVLPIVALTVAVPLVRRERGLVDALSAAADRIASDLFGFASAMLLLLSVSGGIILGAFYLQQILPIVPGMLAGFALALMRVVATYTFVQVFEYEAPVVTEAKRRPKDLSDFPSVWKPQNHDSEVLPKDGD